MSSGATLPAGAKPDQAAAQLSEVLQEIADGLISDDEGAARLGCSTLDLAQLAAVPEIQRVFLAGSAQSKRDGQAIRRRAQALLLRLLTRMGDGVDRLDDEDVPRSVDTVTRVISALTKTTDVAPHAAIVPGIKVVLDPRGIEDARARGLTIDLPGLTDEKLQAALAGGHPIVYELGGRTSATADPTDADGSL